MRLETKIVALIAAIVLGIAIVSSMLVGRPLLQYREEDLKGKGVILAQALSELIAENVINREVLPIYEAIDNVRQNAPDLEYIYVVGFDGRIAAHTFKGGFPRALQEISAVQFQDDSPVYRRFQTENGPILEVGYNLIKGMRGSIHIGLNEARIHGQVGFIRDRFIGTTFGVVGLGILVAIFLGRRIAKPLGLLAGSMQAYGEGKGGEEIVIRSGGREVEQLARSFNRMITDRKRGEDALRESENRYRLLFENNPHPMWVYDIETFAILAVNDAAVQQYGYSREEFLSMSMKDIRPPEDIPALLEAAGNEGLNKTSDRRHLKKDGTIIHVETTSHMLSFGERRAKVVLAYDITARKNLEQELLKAEKLESIGILAGGIAHDFNNLLTAILGNVSLTKLYVQPGGKAYERLVDAEKASLRARDLTQQLLTFSRGGSPIKKTVSIKELISDSACFSIRGSGARCELSIADNLLPVDADEGQLSQVVNNLVINARQAMPNGGTIRISCENVTIGNDLPPLEKGTYVRISIHDEGVGIPLENREKIFEPFFTTKQKGSGLGLATSYSIVKSHGGHISVESEPGSGATFHVLLPAVSTRKGLQKRNYDGKTVCGSGKVLFMDDEQIVRDVAGEMLSNLGYAVEFAQDGTEAIELYTRARGSGQLFDVVIMDLTVPGGMGGKEAVKKLHEIDPDAKVIVSSGYSNDPIMAEFKKYGFRGVVTKPYTIKNLGEVIHTTVRSSKSRTSHC